MLGIYLIHDNQLKRVLIWDYIFPNLDYLHSSWFVLFFIRKVLAVFIICSAIELLRKRYVERLMAAAVDRRWPPVQRMACAVQAKWMRSMGLVGECGLSECNQWARRGLCLTRD